jgi:hypothetical protein
MSLVHGSALGDVLWGGVMVVQDAVELARTLLPAPGAPGGPAASTRRVLGAGTQLLAEEPVKSSTALANASGFSSGMK